MTLKHALPLLFAATLACSAAQKRPPDPVAAGAPSFSADHLREDIATLASDAFEGRAPATEGEKKTVAYVQAQMEAAGLKPGPGGWLQPVPLLMSTVVGKPALEIKGQDGAGTVAFEADWVGWSKRVVERVAVTDAPLVFVGYGVTAPETGHEDWRGVDLRGKVAVLLINDPDFETSTTSDPASPFGGKAMTYYGRWTYKFEEAARQGAAGALIIHEAGPASYPWPVVRSSWTGEQLDIVSPDGNAGRVQVEGWISEPSATALLARAGHTLAALKAAAQKPGFVPVSLPLTLSTRFEVKTERVTSANVFGVVPGAERPEEVVLYSAHWDHLGRCPPDGADDICNGALDNASGTAALLELARAFAHGPRPARTVGFLSVTGEEQGLLGSEHYATHPLFPLEKTAAVINMDGISIFGRTRDYAVVGFGKTDLEPILARAAKAQDRTVRGESFPERGGYYRSDQFSFAKVGVPALYGHSGLDLREGGEARGKALDEAYVSARYHKPSDELTPDWDFSGAVEDLALLYAVGAEVANGAGWPEWTEKAEFRSVRQASSAARAR